LNESAVACWRGRLVVGIRVRELAKTIADAGYSLKGVSRTQRTMADYRAAIERSEK
jgi:hypothetical protein